MLEMGPFKNSTQLRYEVKTYMYRNHKAIKVEPEGITECL